MEAAATASGTFVNTHDLVFVTINYRLGVLGFLSTEDEASPGNFGLWDMVLALNWVKDNIQAFGGDPDDVTVSGESAGGAAVSYLTLAPQAKSLFKKAYAHSGSATSVFGRSTQARKNALEFATSVGCQVSGGDESIEHSRDVLACLKKIPLTDITGFQAFTLDESKFVPRVDGYIVPKDPLVLFSDTEYLRSVGFFDKAHLVALNNNERSIIEAQVKLNEYMLTSQLGLTGTDAQNMLRALHASSKQFYVGTRLQTPSPPEPALKAVDSWYQRRYGENALIEMNSDLNFLIPSVDYIESTTKDASCNAWLLYFNHYPEIIKGHQRGMPHSFDLLYWFDFPLELMKIFLSNPTIEEMREKDLKLKQSFSAVISAFVKTGNPTGALSQHIPTKVPTYNLQSRSHIDFCSTPTLGSNLESSKREFWEQFKLEHHQTEK
ncbi:carboxylic ester hydrolase [Elysia marginata]|uniref:Carboxylic ester hydrolase n=1 Tax=Elysia marginata TaxID=1093978 RepID=A0AAV4GAB4_9GAST|nr:carboxylic ester hydrolase [Elysia marginata]